MRVAFLVLVFLTARAFAGEAAIPVGDGQICAGVATMAAESEKLNLEGCAVPPSVVGKTIEVSGAGPRGLPLVTSVRAWSDPSHVTLSTVASWPGLSGVKTTIAYGTDDTIALQAALDRGGYAKLRDGATYLARNLRWASIARPGNLPTSGLVSQGASRVYFLAGGDSRYGVANRSWVSNEPAAAFGILCQGVTFDGGGNVDDVMVDVSFASTFRNCHWEGGRKYGIHLAGTTENQTPLRNGRENIGFDGSDASFNGSDGLHIDPATPNGRGTTDVEIRGGYWHDNGGYQLYAGLSAGMQMSGVHAYSDRRAPAAFFGSAGFGTTITGNYFEQDVVIGAVNSTSRTATIEGNSFGGALRANFTENAPGAVLLSRGNNFYSGAPGNGIFQGFDGPGRAIISQGDIFRGNSPFSWRGGSVSKGQIVARADTIVRPELSHGTEPCFLDGPMTPSPQGQPRACTDFDVSKTPAPDATSVTYAITAEVAASEGPGAAGFDLEGRLEASASAKAGPVSFDAAISAHCIWPHGAASPSRTAKLSEISAEGGVTASISSNGGSQISGADIETILVKINLPAKVVANSSWVNLRFHSNNRQITSLKVE